MSRLEEIVRSCNRPVLTLVLLLVPLSARAEAWTVRVWDDMLDFRSASHLVEHRPLETAERPWRLCALYPHLKDSYWLSVNYGMVDQARRLGVGLTVKEAGGYHQTARQAAQIRACAEAGADAIVLGTVSHSGHKTLLKEIGRTIPVLGTVNNMDPDGISAMIGVDWSRMGELSGAFLAARHPKETPPVKAAWFPGANKEGISSTKLTSFRRALNDSAVAIVTERYGDTGKRVQLSLIEDVLAQFRDLDYLVGTGVTAEAAIGALRVRKLTDRTKIVAGYFTHGVYRGIKRGKILASPTDQPVLQGRLSIDQAVRLLEGRPYLKHAGPEILFITRDNVKRFPRSQSLSPAFFKPDVPRRGETPMTPQRPRLLIVEDEAVSREKLAAYLRNEDFDVREADGAAAMQAILKDFPVDIVLLDINLPDGNGIDLARNLRAQSDIGIILVTARTDEIDRIVGIEVGADDYVTKPYNPRELLARVRALLRRSQPSVAPREDVPSYRFGRWRLDVLRRKIEGDGGEEVKLTRGEFELLLAFVRRPGVVLSRDYLLDHISHRVWAPNDRIDRRVDRPPASAAGGRPEAPRVDPHRPRRGLRVLRSRGVGIGREVIEAGFKCTSQRSPVAAPFDLERRPAQGRQTDRRRRALQGMGGLAGIRFRALLDGVEETGTLAAESFDEPQGGFRPQGIPVAVQDGRIECRDLAGGHVARCEFQVVGRGKHRLGQVVLFVGLAENAAHPGFEELPDLVPGDVGGQRQDGHGGDLRILVGAQSPSRLDAVHHRHADIHQHHRRSLGDRHRDGLGARLPLRAPDVPSLRAWSAPPAD